MPRYFFDTVDGGRDQDAEGTVLADASAARVAAIRLAGDVISDQPELLHDGREFRVNVTVDGDGQLFTVVTRVEDAVR